MKNQIGLQAKFFRIKTASNFYTDIEASSQPKEHRAHRKYGEVCSAVHSANLFPPEAGMDIGEISVHSLGNEVQYSGHVASGNQEVQSHQTGEWLSEQGVDPKNATSSPSCMPT